MSKPRIFFSKNSSNAILFFGGIALILLGGFLSQNLKEGEVEKTVGLLFSFIFIVFGAITLLSILDNLYIIIRSDSITIKSLLRKRKILRSEIIGYGVKNIKGKWASGQKISILTPEKKITIDCTRFDFLANAQILNTLKNKKRIKGLFKIEYLLHSIYFYATTVISLVLAAFIIIIIFLVFLQLVLHL